MSISFTDQVAIVTGAGNGLGRSHALELAKRGAKVVVNDLGGGRDGSGASSEAALSVVAEIKAAGGIAIANGANVTNFEDVKAMVDAAMNEWGRVDILVNNAGILRDKSFAKMDLTDFQTVMDVHLMGSVNCCKAVWDIMREQNYGRIAMTTSGSGLYGNFGQSSYTAAKMALIGLMNTLVIEGAKHDIRINALSPTAATRMTQDLMPADVLAKIPAASASAGLLALVHKDAPNRTILCAGAGCYSLAKLCETDGIYIAEEQTNPESIVTQWSELIDDQGQVSLHSVTEQLEKMFSKAASQTSAG
jgi:NAD(P)-dependent dehydrogenase (short-subunit alcohol dehydrogenase family)